MPHGKQSPLWFEGSFGFQVNLPMGRRGFGRCTCSAWPATWPNLQEAYACRRLKVVPLQAILWVLNFNGFILCVSRIFASQEMQQTGFGSVTVSVVAVSSYFHSVGSQRKNTSQPRNLSPLIGHFRIILCLLFKARLRAKPFWWKWVWSSCEWNSFSYERLCIKTRFEKEAQDNSEMVYSPRVHVTLITWVNEKPRLLKICVNIFVRRHYLTRKGNSFPRDKHEENCEPRGTDEIKVIVFVILQIFSKPVPSSQVVGTQGRIQGGWIGWLATPSWGRSSLKLWEGTKLPPRRFCLRLFRYRSVRSTPPLPQKSWFHHWDSRKTKGTAKESRARTGEKESGDEKEASSPSWAPTCFDVASAFFHYFSVGRFWLFFSREYIT